jgi:hypothetical protein
LKNPHPSGIRKAGREKPDAKRRDRKAGSAKDDPLFRKGLSERKILKSGPGSGHVKFDRSRNVKSSGQVPESEIKRTCPEM